MTQDEIMEMARQAGGFDATPEFLERFAKLVAAKATAKEREECAVACEKELEYWGWNIVFDSASLIRARGEQA
jgi:hypothetical protein